MATLHAGWRRIVSEIGLEFASPWAVDMLREAGQEVSGETVKFDPDWVMKQVAKEQCSYRWRLNGLRCSLWPTIRT